MKSAGIQKKDEYLRFFLPIRDFMKFSCRVKSLPDRIAPAARPGEKREKCRVIFFQTAKKQKDYCVSLGIKKFRVEITAIIAYNLEML